MAHPSILNTGSSTFQADVIDSPVPVLVDFWAEWCGPCKMIAPVLDEIAAELGSTVRIAKVNVDDNRELAGQFGVRSIPMLFFVKNGEVKEKIVGLVPKDQLISKLKALA